MAEAVGSRCLLSPPRKLVLLLPLLLLLQLPHARLLGSAGRRQSAQRCMVMGVAGAGWGRGCVSIGFTPGLLSATPQHTSCQCALRRPSAAQSHSSLPRRRCICEHRPWMKHDSTTQSTSAPQRPAAAGTHCASAMTFRCLGFCLPKVTGKAPRRVPPGPSVSSSSSAPVQGQQGKHMSGSEEPHRLAQPSRLPAERFAPRSTHTKERGWGCGGAIAARHQTDAAEGGRQRRPSRILPACQRRTSHQQHLLLRPLCVLNVLQLLLEAQRHLHAGRAGRGGVRQEQPQAQDRRSAAPGSGWKQKERGVLSGCVVKRLRWISIVASFQG